MKRFAVQFGGLAVARVIRRWTAGRPFGVVAIRVLGDSMQSDGIVGHARSWSGAVKVLRDRGYRVLRVGGCVGVYEGAELGLPAEWVVCVTVHHERR